MERHVPWWKLNIPCIKKKSWWFVKKKKLTNAIAIDKDLVSEISFVMATTLCYNYSPSISRTVVLVLISNEERRARANALVKYTYMRARFVMYACFPPSSLLNVLYCRCNNSRGGCSLLRGKRSRTCTSKCFYFTVLGIDFYRFRK